MTKQIPSQDNLIVDKTFNFAVCILKYSQNLQDQKQYVVARQLQRCGTSIGANTREAQNAESKADFIHKFKVAAKEADETEYWLLLCNEIKPDEIIKNLLTELKIIQKIITKIIATSKNQLANKQID